VFYIVIRRNVSTRQHGKSQLDKTCAVGVSLVRDGTDQWTSRGSDFLQCLLNAVLSDDGDIALSL
jgi:hypothetical protein